MTAPLIHIGYHKTGSTWLQKAFFNRAECGFALPCERRDITALLVRPGPFSVPPPSLGDECEAQFARARSRGLVPVISHERLSGYGPAGGFDAKEVADRLHVLWPDGRLLIVIREQQRLIRSMYAQYVRDGGVLRLREYLGPLQPNLVRVRQFDLALYEFDYLIRYYRQKFGEQAVLVLPVEMLAASPEEFVARIAAFAGVPPPPSILKQGLNVGMRPASVPLMRLGNRLFSRNQLGPGALFPSRRASALVNRLALVTGRAAPRFVQRRIDGRLRELVELTVGSRYQASNSRTSAMIDIDLTQYGYDCGA